MKSIDLEELLQSAYLEGFCDGINFPLPPVKPPDIAWQESETKKKLSELIDNKIKELNK